MNYYFPLSSYYTQIIHLFTKYLSNAYYELNTVISIAETAVDKIVKKSLTSWSLITRRGQTIDNKQNIINKCNM